MNLSDLMLELNLDPEDATARLLVRSTDTWRAISEILDADDSQESD